MNLVLSLTQYWFTISVCPSGEILKRPMKQVQGMVQDDSNEIVGQPSAGSIRNRPLDSVRISPIDSASSGN